MNVKEIVGFIGVLLTFVGYIPYIKDVLHKKTRPHIYTWFTWALLSFIIFALQISDHAGPGAYVTLASGVICFIIFLLALRQGEKDITTTDTVLLCMAFVSLILWIFAKQPVLSTILIVAVDVIAFLPTVRKSWYKPHQETAVSFIITAVRHGLSVIALDQYTIVTGTFPITWVVVNSLFVCMLYVRRLQLSQR